MRRRSRHRAKEGIGTEVEVNRRDMRRRSRHRAKEGIGTEVEVNRRDLREKRKKKGLKETKNEENNMC